ncbi:hypothetical protein DFP72DRAFT_34984 [Ephemerocybe angulata]|uniref:F-box domain-containing protein n=1 Tax=Ephemerocybe angulata TaxID=980116 RepID=A0A8H6IB55_9AGAR|nr:hypothetical protein DFP72DRAFT_34984 [Tulosesus angulatus]
MSFRRFAWASFHHKSGLPPSHHHRLVRVFSLLIPHMEQLPPSSSFSDLPEDIARIVFQLVADRATTDALACALVCKMAKLWVEPSIYREVVVDAGGLFLRTVKAPTSTKPPDFFAVHVKSLFFESVENDVAIAEVLQKCRSVTSLAFWDIGSGYKTSLSQNLSTIALTPTRLSLLTDLVPPTGRHFRHPIFQAVTHLDLCVEPNKSPGWTWTTLKEMASLTHLSLFLSNVGGPRQFAQVPVKYLPPSFRVLVICVHRSADDDEIKAMSEGRVDPRAMVAFLGTSAAEEPPCRHTFFMTWTEFQNEWKHPSKVYPDAWTRAEKLIEQRQLEQSGKCKTILLNVFMCRRTSPFIPQSLRPSTPLESSCPIKGNP